MQTKQTSYLNALDADTTPLVMSSTKTISNAGSVNVNILELSKKYPLNSLAELGKYANIQKKIDAEVICRLKSKKKEVKKITSHGP